MKYISLATSASKEKGCWLWLVKRKKMFAVSKGEEDLLDEITEVVELEEKIHQF